MERQIVSKISQLRETLKAFYLKHDQKEAAIKVDRLPNRSVVRLFKVIFGSGAFNEIKEAI